MRVLVLLYYARCLVPQNSRHVLNQSERRFWFNHLPKKQKQNKTTVDYMHLSSYSDWFIALSVTVVIGQRNYFGFGFKTQLISTLLD